MQEVPTLKGWRQVQSDHMTIIHKQMPQKAFESLILPPASQCRIAAILPVTHEVTARECPGSLAAVQSMTLEFLLSQNASQLPRSYNRKVVGSSLCIPTPEANYLRHLRINLTVPVGALVRHRES